MKNATLTILLLFVAKSVAAEECETDADCSENQCCLSKGLKPVKSCADRSPKNEFCVVADTGDRDHFIRCPCQVGLICKPTVYEKLRYIGRTAVIARCMTSDTENSANVKPASEALEETNMSPQAKAPIKSQAGASSSSQAEISTNDEASNDVTE